MEKSLYQTFAEFPQFPSCFLRSLSRHGVDRWAEHYKRLNSYCRLSRVRSDASFWSVWQIHACHGPDLIRL